MKTATSLVKEGSFGMALGVTLVGDCPGFRQIAKCKTRHDRIPNRLAKLGAYKIVARLAYYLVMTVPTVFSKAGK